MSEYVTGTGQTLRGIHDTSKCAGEHCVIHQPSQHPMRLFRTHWRPDRGLMERICPHGVGHPDPDSLAFVAREVGVDRARTECVHGCDGCCAGSYDWLKPEAIWD